MEIKGNRIADASIYNNKSFFDQPKEYYKLVLSEIQRQLGHPESLLDIGCANGSFLHHAIYEFDDCHFFGAEPVSELAKIAQENTAAKIYQQGLFEIQEEKKYNVVTMLGVLGIFSDVENVIAKLSRLISSGGAAFIFSPFNEEEIDVVLNYRRAPQGPWESGHNLFSMRTLEVTASNFGLNCQWINFQMSKPIEKTDDPMRSWTEPFRGNKNHLIYGTNMFSTMKLLVLQGAIK